MGHYVSSKSFTFNKVTKTFTTEISNLGKDFDLVRIPDACDEGFMTQIYPDACDGLRHGFPCHGQLGEVRDEQYYH